MQCLDHEEKAWVNWWGWISVLEFLANDNTRSVTNMTHNSAASWLTSSDFFQWDHSIRTHLFSNVDFPVGPAGLETLTVPNARIRAKSQHILGPRNFMVKKRLRLWAIIYDICRASVVFLDMVIPVRKFVHMTELCDG